MGRSLLRAMRQYELLCAEPDVRGDNTRSAAVLYVDALQNAPVLVPILRCLQQEAPRSTTEIHGAIHHDGDLSAVATAMLSLWDAKLIRRETRRLHKGDLRIDGSTRLASGGREWAYRLTTRGHIVAELLEQSVDED